jgi:hypothetical protein
MAKKQRKKPAPKPILYIAAFCTRILEGIDGINSAIRIVDHLYVPLPPDYKPDDRIPVTFWALIGFRARTFTAGELTGKHSLHLIMISPKGKSKPGGTLSIDVPESVTSFNFRVKLALTIKTPGLWWADVVLDDRRYTRMPLRIVFLRDTSAVAGSEV